MDTRYHKHILVSTDLTTLNLGAYISSICNLSVAYSLSLICQPDIRGHEAPHHLSVVRVQQLCESGGGRPGLPVRIVSMDIKQH